MDTLNSLEVGLKELDAALGIKCKRFQNLVENAPSGMAMIGEDGKFLYINPKFKEMFGYDLKDIPCGRAWFQRPILIRLTGMRSYQPGSMI